MRRNPFGSQVDFFQWLKGKEQSKDLKVAIPSDLRSISLYSMEVTPWELTPWVAIPSDLRSISLTEIRFLAWSNSILSQSLRISGRFLWEWPLWLLLWRFPGRNPFGSQVDFFSRHAFKSVPCPESVAIPSDLRSISFKDLKSQDITLEKIMSQSLRISGRFL